MKTWTRSQLARLRRLQLDTQALIEDLGTDAPGAEALIAANEELANAELCATTEPETEMASQ